MVRTKISDAVIRSVLTEAGYRCAVPTCRNILAIDMHHIVEVKDGGPNEQSNLLALCPTCHALYTRGTILRESINAWKTMLVALNHAFDQETISNLLFLYQVSEEVQKKADELIKQDIKGRKLRKDADGTLHFIDDNIIKDLNLLVFSGDGVLKFSHLIASGLAIYQVAAKSYTEVKYYVVITDKGRRIVKAWFSGNRSDVKEALGFLPEA